MKNSQFARYFALLMALLCSIVCLFTIAVQGQTNMLPPLSSIVQSATVVSNSDGSIDIVQQTVYGPATNHFVPANMTSPTSIAEDFYSGVNKLLKSTNMFWEAHAMYASGLDKKVGGGIGGFYLINNYTYAGIRLDWVNGGFWMPEGNVGLQLPIVLASWLTVTPFTYGGIGVPLSGATVGGITLGTAPRDNQGQATAILGAGVAVKVFNLSSKWDLGLLGDAEKWTGFAGDQYRIGLFLKRKM
jgi:hypothetical protein